MKISVKEMKDRAGGLHGIASRLGISEWPHKTGVCSSPLRPDKNDSFSIFEKDGELFWKDHATSEGGDSILLIQAVKQCDPKSAIQWLADKLGIVDEPRDPKKKSGKGSSWEHRELVAIYDYKDDSGSIMHQTLRYRDTQTGAKTFLQRRPAREGDRFGKYEAKLDRQRGGWWIWNLGGIEPVIYHLPEIAARPEDEVWIFEGEKDADNAAKMGLLSTTSPMGAGKWRASFSEALRGRSVSICPDRDAPGTTHAMLVALELLKVDCAVQIVEWKFLWPDAPEGKLDFSDWGEKFLAASQTKEAA